MTISSQRTMICLSALAAGTLLLFRTSRGKTKSNGSGGKSFAINEGKSKPDNRTHTTQDLVELSAIQKLLLDGQDQGNEQVVSCVVLGGRTPTTAQIKSAIRSVQSRDPTLKSAVMLLDANLYLAVTDETAKISGALTVVEDGDWECIANKYANEIHFPKPTEESPLTATWKLTFVKGKKESAFVFSLNHVCFDGTSRNRLIRAVMESLSDDPSQMALQPTQVPLFSDSAIRASIEHMPWTRFVVDCVRMVYREIKFRNHRWALPLDDAPGILDANATRATKQILFQLSKDETSAMVRRSKAEGTTVHGALVASATLALIALGQEKGYSIGKSYVEASHLISLWGSADMTAGAIAGMILSFASTGVCVTDSSRPWDLARETKSQLSNFAPYSARQMLMRFMIRQRIRRTFPNEYIRLRTSPLVVFSNNGLVHLADDYGGTTVEAIYACSSGNNFPGRLGVMNVQTLRGRCCIGMAYYPQIWSEATAEAYVAHFKRILLETTAA